MKTLTPLARLRLVEQQLAKEAEYRVEVAARRDAWQLRAETAEKIVADVWAELEAGQCTYRRGQPLTHAVCDAVDSERRRLGDARTTIKVLVKMLAKGGE